MNSPLNWLGFFQKMITSFAEAGDWLVRPVFPNVPGLEMFSPITIITFGGLAAFIVVAIVKWVIS